MKLIAMFVFFLVLLQSCTISAADKGLHRWTGAYSFDEEPLDAGDGNIMVMDWQLKITSNDSVSEGILEVNGHLTLKKIKTRISGDSTTMHVLYDSLLDGAGDNLEKNDTLFLLKRSKDSLVTEWRRMRPILREDTPPACTCFYQLNYTPLK